jgi:hypothetical protein
MGPKSAGRPRHLRFRHPLVRSAIYQDATFTARRAAHWALTQVLEDEPHSEWRAWHLAAAAIGTDEPAAVALEEMEPAVSRFERWAERDRRTWT